MGKCLFVVHIHASIKAIYHFMYKLIVQFRSMRIYYAAINENGMINPLVLDNLSWMAKSKTKHNSKLENLKNDYLKYQDIFS